MRRKSKGILALFLALALFFTLSPAALAVEDVFFVAVGDTVPLTLTGVAPYYSAGSLFVPYTVFDAAPGGVASAYNAEEQTFVLFTRASRLIFDLAAQTVKDENGTVSDVTVSYRGGVLYVPLALCASHFDLGTSMLTSSGGYTVLRFTTGSEVYEDSLFIEKAENLIAYRISQLEQPAQQDPPSPPPAETDPGRPVEEEPPAAEPAVCDLAITGAGGMEAAADLLAERSLRAAFFLTKEEIAENPDLVRSLFVAGHTLGLRTEAGCEDVGAALDAANDALWQALGRKTVLALADPADETLTGYRVFPADASQEAPEPGQRKLTILGEDAAQQLAVFFELGVSVSQIVETTQTG